MNNMNFRRFYLFSVLGILLISIYPLYMGIVSITDYIRYGWIDVANYHKYIIPYTPISISLIVTVLLMPLFFKFFRKYALFAGSIMGIGLFFAGEIVFENMIVMEGVTRAEVEAWQLLSCIATPQVWKSVGHPLIDEYSPSFKVHFYIISIVIILSLLNVLYGFAKMIRENHFDKKRPLIAQGILTVIFIGLCILACFTAFFRNGTIHISTLSATLMSVFFITFGVTFGLYTGSILYTKNKLASRYVPSLIAFLTTFVMYVGELVMMDGELFKYGKGFLFEPLGNIPFAAIDLAVMLLSGVVTYTILALLQNRKNI